MKEKYLAKYKRKVIKHSSSSVLLTLPKPWTDSQEIKGGDFVYCFTDKSGNLSIQKEDINLTMAEKKPVKYEGETPKLDKRSSTYSAIFESEPRQTVSDCCRRIEKYFSNKTNKTFCIEDLETIFVVNKRYDKLVFIKAMRFFNANGAILQPSTGVFKWIGELGFYDKYNRQ